MRLQEQTPQRVLHARANVALGDAPEPGEHDQCLPACQVVQQGIELGTVADSLPHLGLEHSRELVGQKPSLRRSPQGGPSAGALELVATLCQNLPNGTSVGTLERLAWLSEGWEHWDPDCPPTRGQRLAKAWSTLGSKGADGYRNALIVLSDRVYATLYS